MAIGAAVCVACITLALQAKTPPANYDIAELLKQNPQDYALSFGHILDLTPEAMGAFRIPLLVTGIAFALGTVLNWFLRRSNRTLPANLVLAVMTLVLLHQAQAGLTTFSPVLSSKVLADAIESHWQRDAIIEDNGDYEAASSVNYYTHRQMRILNGRCNNIWYGSTFPDAPKIFDDDASFEKLWRGNRTVFLLLDAKAEPGIKSREECPQRDRLPDYLSSAKGCVLAKWGGKLVLTNELKLCPLPAWRK